FMCMGIVMASKTLLNGYQEKNETFALTDYLYDQWEEWIEHPGNAVRLSLGILIFAVLVTLMAFTHPAINLIDTTSPISYAVNTVVNFLSNAVSLDAGGFLSPTGASIFASILLGTAVLAVYDSICRVVVWIFSEESNSFGEVQEFIL